MKKAVVFDFDGTLADTLPLVFHCFRTVLRKYGKNQQLDVSDSGILKLFGPTEIQILQQFVIESDLATAIDEFLTLYEAEHKTYVKQYEEIDEMLRRLTADGIKLAIFTGKGRPTYDISVRQLDMMHFCEVSVTGDDVIQQKPHSEGLQTAIDALGVKASDTVMVGDSNGDVAAARDLGMDVVAVNWLSTSQTREFELEPTLRTDSVDTFLHWLYNDSK